MRSLESLIDTKEPGIELVNSWLDQAENACELLPPSESRGECLHRLQVTTRSPMGALAYDSGGLLVDHGWLRFLGSGHRRLARDLAGWNQQCNGYLLVADDVLGGFFALDGGSLGFDPGVVCYLPYDGLNWESLEIGFSQFLRWSLSSRLGEFYGNDRWDGWKMDVAELNGDQCFAFYPFLWTVEGSVGKSRRSVVSAKEAFELKMEIRRQLS